MHCYLGWLKVAQSHRFATTRVVFTARTTEYRIGRRHAYGSALGITPHAYCGLSGMTSFNDHCTRLQRSSHRTDTICRKLQEDTSSDER